MSGTIDIDKEDVERNLIDSMDSVDRRDIQNHIFSFGGMGEGTLDAGERSTYVMENGKLKKVR